MTEQEKLNEKLAKWTGFRKAPYTTRLYYAPTEKLPHEVPNFTDSLDACFKWLVPKLKMYELNAYNANGNHVACATLEEDGGWQCATNNNPALALCLAIEKQITPNG